MFGGLVTLVGFRDLSQNASTPQDEGRRTETATPNRPRRVFRAHTSGVEREMPVVEHFPPHMEHGKPDKGLRKSPVVHKKIQGPLTPKFLPVEDEIDSGCAHSTTYTKTASGWTDNSIFIVRGHVSGRAKDKMPGVESRVVVDTSSKLCLRQSNSAAKTQENSAAVKMPDPQNSWTRNSRRTLNVGLTDSCRSRTNSVLVSLPPDKDGTKRSPQPDSRSSRKVSFNQTMEVIECSEVSDCDSRSVDSYDGPKCCCFKTPFP
ncbi:hypothetical protein BaRGS_00005915 [Batillaria attramentaria]|uniref:Uncharacterized protein n=1 Tax=Batillaria attramentaria TaxID=370345 RepID=A0ABD0LV55_9CAEN